MSSGADDAGEPLAVLCLDLDGFKAVNDLHGHPAGDELLIDVAHRLRSIVARQRAGRPPRRRRVRHRPAGRQPAGPCRPPLRADHAGARRAASHRRPERADQRQHRRRRLSGRRRKPERPHQECRSGALPGQGRGPRPRPASTRRRWTRRCASGASSRPTFASRSRRKSSNVHYQPLADLGTGTHLRLRGAAALESSAARPDQPGRCSSASPRRAG